uniref:inositol-polyphosphate 5-phosphatase n=1 Tax=Balaenoptera musculus TaxID=9771 RepID=A0A8C0I0P3_BALMU
MAGKAAAPGTAVLLVTANVGSLFDDPENLQKNWLREFYQVVHAHRPHFLALHCQEFGGKNYEASMSHVDKFVRELLSSDAMTEYSRARVYLDEDYKSQEHFTALGSFYFLHESLKNISQFDFKAKKYKKVTGKEIYSDTLESTPMLEKEKFPQDYFPECKWSRKGFIRTRWCLADCAFDLVNIHLFHDASNLVAWETSPSVYSGIRHKALGYVLDRIIDQRFEKASYFVFGDFNFRLDSKSVVETLCTKATMQTVRAADTNEVVKLIFRESDNDRKVMLQLEKKLFDYFNQEVFRDDNGTALLEFDKELSVFKDRLYELDISFPPREAMPAPRGDPRRDLPAARGATSSDSCIDRPACAPPLDGRPHTSLPPRTALRTSLTYLTVVSVRVTSSRNMGIFLNKSQSCRQNSNRQQRDSAF